MVGLRYRAQVGLLALVASALVGTAAVAQAAPSFVPGRVLVGFRPGVSVEHAGAVFAAAGAHSVGQIPQLGVHVVQLPPQASEVAAAHAFAHRPEVAFAEPDALYAPVAVPNDPSYASQWHLPKISAPAAWDATTGSSSIVIAILDTGCDPAHPDLAPKYVPGWNCYDNNSNTSDVHGHGTAVAGTAAAFTNNGAGVAGVAWSCRIMPVRIGGPDGSASTSTIATGLTWAADHGARVANNSYQTSGSATVASAAQYFMNKGGVVTISAGNYSAVHTNADNPYVLTVSATDGSDLLASWSDRGSDIDVAAPGVSILTTTNGGGYGSWSGTSFSAPVVAGVAALVLSANPGLTGQQAQNIVKQSADDLGAAGWDGTYGWGRVNAARAVSLALGTVGTTDITPPTVSFGASASGATVSGTVSVQVTASDNAAVASVSLSVDGVLLGTDTTSPYSFSWNTLGVANSMHTLTATAKDTSGNTASAQTTFTVSNTADATAPTVSITSPAGGAKVGNSVSVTVLATDNVGVVKVELYLDGKLTATSTTAPFTTKWNARKAPAGAHTLQCKAYDAKGNVGSSAVVTVYR